MDSFNGKLEYISHGETVQFACENGFVRNAFLANNYTFECTNGKFNETLSYDDLLCKSDFHKNTVVARISSVLLRSRLFKCDGNDLELYRVSAKKNDGNIKDLYDVCFDKSVMRPKFVYHLIHRNDSVKAQGRRQTIWNFDFFGENTQEKFNLSVGYVSKNQKLLLTRVFSEKYNSSYAYPYYFNRGHLAPSCDFVESDDKKASNAYINVAPQWQALNANSWSRIEKKTNELVRKNPLAWEIFTGLYGIIPTHKGPLFLSPVQNNSGQFVKGSRLPVPKLFWKIVHNTFDKAQSRVFVGINDPELKSPENFTEDYVICKPVEKNPIFEGNKNMGFTYECRLDEFIAKIRRDEEI